jgi:hypothetical protein
VKGYDWGLTLHAVDSVDDDVVVQYLLDDVNPFIKEPHRKFTEETANLFVATFDGSLLELDNYFRDVVSVPAFIAKREKSLLRHIQRHLPVRIKKFSSASNLSPYSTPSSAVFPTASTPTASSYGFSTPSSSNPRPSHLMNISGGYRPPALSSEEELRELFMDIMMRGGVLPVAKLDVDKMELVEALVERNLLRWRDARIRKREARLSVRSGEAGGLASGEDVWSKLMEKHQMLQQEQLLMQQKSQGSAGLAEGVVASDENGGDFERVGDGRSDGVQSPGNGGVDSDSFDTMDSPSDQIPSLGSQRPSSAFSAVGRVFGLGKSNVSPPPKPSSTSPSNSTSSGRSRTRGSSGGVLKSGNASGTVESSGKSVGGLGSWFRFGSSSSKSSPSSPSGNKEMTLQAASAESSAQPLSSSGGNALSSQEWDGPIMDDGWAGAMSVTEREAAERQTRLSDLDAAEQLAVLAQEGAELVWSNNLVRTVCENFVNNSNIW